VTCDNCVLYDNALSFNGGCSKSAVIQHSLIGVVNKNVLRYLDFEIHCLDGRFCKIKFNASICTSRDYQKKAAFERFKKRVDKNIAIVENAPLSVVRRVCRFKRSRFVLRAHCCYIHCPDEDCVVRGRGKRCPKQKKLPIAEAT